MKIIFLITLLSLLQFVSVPAWAQQWDGRLSAGLRTYPLSGGVSAGAGYGLLLWGQPDADNPWYGYVRPAAQYFTAGSYNAYMAELNNFPISFAGLRIGVESVLNSSDYSGYDCVSYQCQGEFKKKFVEGIFAAKHRDYFALLRIRYDDFTHEDKNRPIVDPSLGILAQDNYDYFTTYRLSVGRVLTEKYSLAVDYTHGSADRSQQTSRMFTANIIRAEPPYRYFIGAGVFDSSIKSYSETVVLGVQRNFGSSVSLF